MAPHFAHLLGNRGPVAYYEYSRPGQLEMVPSARELKGIDIAKSHFPKAHDFGGNYVGDKYVNFQFGNEAPFNTETPASARRPGFTKEDKARSRAYQFSRK